MTAKFLTRSAMPVGRERLAGVPGDGDGGEEEEEGEGEETEETYYRGLHLVACSRAPNRGRNGLRQGALLRT